MGWKGDASRLLWKTEPHALPHLFLGVCVQNKHQRLLVATHLEKIDEYSFDTKSPGTERYFDDQYEGRTEKNTMNILGMFGDRRLDQSVPKELIPDEPRILSLSHLVAPISHCIPQYRTTHSPSSKSIRICLQQHLISILWLGVERKTSGLWAQCDTVAPKGLIQQGSHRSKVTKFHDFSRFFKEISRSFWYNIFWVPSNYIWLQYLQKLNLYFPKVKPPLPATQKPCIFCCQKAEVPDSLSKSQELYKVISASVLSTGKMKQK